MYVFLKLVRKQNSIDSIDSQSEQKIFDFQSKIVFKNSFHAHI